MSGTLEEDGGLGGGDMDVLKLSSSLLCELSAEKFPDGQALPEWCAPMTLGKYQSRAYERSETVLRGLLSLDRYTRDSHPSVGQWTESGDNLLIAVDTRSLREMRDEVPNWIMDDAASVSDQLILDRKLTEDFVGESINQRGFSLLGFLGWRGSHRQFTCASLWFRHSAPTRRTIVMRGYRLMNSWRYMNWMRL